MMGSVRERPPCREPGADVGPELEGVGRAPTEGSEDEVPDEGWLGTQQLRYHPGCRPLMQPPGESEPSPPDPSGPTALVLRVTHMSSKARQDPQSHQPSEYTGPERHPSSLLVSSKVRLQDQPNPHKG